MSITSSLLMRAPAIGFVSGAGLGGVYGYNAKDFRGKKPGEIKQRQKITNALSGAIAGGVDGFLLGIIARNLFGTAAYYRSYGGKSGGRSYAGGYSSGPKHKEATNLSEALKKAKTKAQAKTAYRKASVKTHPDKNPEMGNKPFQDVADEWEKFRYSGKFDKLAFLKAVYNKSFETNLNTYRKNDYNK